MTVRVNKPEFNLREKLTELERPIGLKGSELMRAETTQEARDLVSAGRKNIIINGAMQVAQRGTSSTGDGYVTVDRFAKYLSNGDEAPTQAQHALTSSDTGPWEKGFRYSCHMTNGDQTSGAGAAVRMSFTTILEAQDLANSGWDYTSASSYITLSYWVKSSVAQNFYGRLYSYDGTSQGYSWETGSLSANTWTKVTTTIPGDSNLTFDNNNGGGIYMVFSAYSGTDQTDPSNSLNTWAAFDAGNRFPTFPTTWYTTDGATFEITGVQLEVGRAATEFEHRSYGEELALCQRYYEKLENVTIQISAIWANGDVKVPMFYKVTKRATPTVTNSGGTFVNYDVDGGWGTNTPSILYISPTSCVISSNNGGAQNTLSVVGVDFLINAEL